MDIHELKANEYSDFLRLWKQAFGDDRDIVEEFCNTFGDDLKKFVLTDDNGSVCSALTLFRMGKLTGLPEAPASVDREGAEPASVGHGGTEAPASVDREGAEPASVGHGGTEAPDVYVSYAICTDEAARGHGYGSKITVFAADRARGTGAGGFGCIDAPASVSMLSPASDSLINFYEPLGYKPLFKTIQQSISAEDARGSISGIDEAFGALSADVLKVKVLTPEEYNAAREDLLSGTPHISLTPASLEYVKICSKYVTGENGKNGGFYEISDNSGSLLAICVSEGIWDGSLILTELIISDLDNSLAAPALKMMDYYGAAECTFNAPVPSTYDGEAHVQAMIAADDSIISSLSQDSAKYLPYFGFPFE